EFNGKLYGCGYNTISSTSNGWDWVVEKNWPYPWEVESAPSYQFTYMFTFNGMLYAWANNNYNFSGLFESSNGSTWTLSSFTVPADIKADTVYKGKLYIACSNARVYSTTDMKTWTQVLSADNQVVAFAKHDGKLFASTIYSWGNIYSTSDGTNWELFYDTPQNYVDAIASVNGKLFAGTYGNPAVLYKFAPVTATFGGTDGTKSAQTLEINGLELAQSTNSVTCNGTSACGATNQIKILVSDMVENSRTGIFSVLVNNSAPTPPDVSLSLVYPSAGMKVNSSALTFSWNGISTTTLAALPAGSYYQIQAHTDLSFSNPAVNITTPAVYDASMADLSSAGASYVSTYTLSSNNYYWRARVYSNGVGFSQWSGVTAFVTDLTVPALSAFRAISSTGGAIGYNEWLTHISPQTTMQISVQDLLSGLAISTYALASSGDGHDGAGTTNGFGLSYSADAGANWITHSTVTVSYDSTAADILSMAVYDGKLYAGFAGGVYVYDGSAWNTSAGSPPGGYSLAVYNGKLYNGAGGDGKIFVFDGTSWTESFDAPPSTGIYIHSLAVYNGKLYAGASNYEGNGTVYVYDGSAWSTARSLTVGYAYSMVVYNGRLYLGTGAEGIIYVFDGFNWTTAYDSSETSILSMAVYNGKLYAGTGANGLIYVYNGSSWSESYDTPESDILSMTVFNGRLYAGTRYNGVLYVYDDSSWKVEYDSSEGGFFSLTGYNGKFYAGTGPGALVYEMAPLTAAYTSGTDGDTSVRTLSFDGFSVALSTNSSTCNGTDTCAAINQVKFSASDMAGNVKSGIYSVLADSITYLAVATPNLPKDDSYIYTSSLTFAWGGPSTSSVDAFGAGSYFNFEVSDASNFSNIVESSHVPVAVTTYAPTADGYYAISDANKFTEGTKYYWRVSLYIPATNRSSDWSPTYSFTRDIAAPAISAFILKAPDGSNINYNQSAVTLAAYSTAYITAQDILSGLAVSTYALTSSGDGHGGQYDPANGFGVSYSTDSGNTWIAYASTSSVLSGIGEKYVRAFKQFKGRIYAITDGTAKVYSSADGLTWRMDYDVPDDIAYCITEFNGKLYVGSYPNGLIYSSSDGLAWDLVFASSETSIGSLAVFNGRIYAGSLENGYIYTSANGTDWSAVYDSAETKINTLSVFNGRLYMGTSPNGRIYSSEDGVTWSLAYQTGETSVHALATFNGRFYAGSGSDSAGKVYSTEDGVTWTAIFTAAEKSVNAFGLANGKLFAGTSQNGTVYATANGSAWEKYYATPLTNVE
ncbi:MAG: hypothetical protein WCS77_10220, partial [Elusimicrobiaceae bacterium]